MHKEKRDYVQIDDTMTEHVYIRLPMLVVGFVYYYL